MLVLVAKMYSSNASTIAPQSWIQLCTNRRVKTAWSSLTKSTKCTYIVQVLLELQHLVANGVSTIMFCCE